MLDMFEKFKNYIPPEFGTFRWLNLQAGYQKLSKTINEDHDIKNAIIDLMAVVSKGNYDK